MKRKVFICVVILAFGTMVFLVLRGSGSSKGLPPDRIVQGKPISEWVKQTLASDQYYRSAPALAEAGDDAVPYIIRAFKRRDWVGNTVWVAIWAKLPDFVKRRMDAPILARDRRLRAVVALREMGPRAKSAVPALIGRLSDTDGTTRLHAAIALGNIGPDAISAVPALQPFLTNRSHTVRVYTADSVWKITKEAEPSLTVLEEGLKDRQASFRWAAAVFLGDMGAAARGAIPLLEQATKEPDKEIVSLSAQALAEIGPETVSILTNLLADPDPGIRISAATALGKLGVQARDAVPMLVKALDDHARGAPVIMGRSSDPEDVSGSARKALGLIDPDSLKRREARP